MMLPSLKESVGQCVISVLHTNSPCLCLFQHVDMWSFNVFALNEASGDHSLKFVFYELLTRYDLINRFKVSVCLSVCPSVCPSIYLFLSANLVKPPLEMSPRCSNNMSWLTATRGRCSNWTAPSTIKG